MNIISLATKLKLGIDGLLISGSIKGGHLLADEKSVDDPNWLTDKATTDMFKEATNTVQSVGKSGYSFIRALGIVVLLVGASMAGIAIALSSGGNKREEGKSKLVNVLIGGAIIFGVVGVITIIVSIGNGLNPTTTTTP